MAFISLVYYLLLSMVLVKPLQGLTDMLLVNMKMKTTQKTQGRKKKGIAKVDLAAGQNESI